MIYAELSSGQKLIVLEPGNFDRLRVGKPAITPDESVIIAFTPDIRWTSEQLEKARANGGLSGEKFGSIMLESLKRDEIHEREYHSKKIL